MTYVGTFCQEMSGIFSCFIHVPKTFCIIRLAPPAGTPVATVVRWGGAGASGGGLTWPVARGGSVQGFPCRHYGRCVLDEHIAWRPMPTRQRVSGRSGTDGNGNRRRGAEAAPRTKIRKARPSAPLPDFSLRARERSLKMARCESRRGDDGDRLSGRRPSPRLRAAGRPAPRRRPASDAASEREKTYPTTIGVLPLTRL